MVSKFRRERSKYHHQKGPMPITELPIVLYSKIGKYDCTKHIDSLQTEQKYKLAR